MKSNPWTVALLGAGLISLPSVLSAEEKQSSILTALSSTTLSGYVDTSAQWNFGTGDAHTPNYAFSQGKADGFNLNVVKVSLEKPLDSAEKWSAGYKVDMIYGPDADTLATQSTGVAGDFALKQAYVALRAPIGNGLDLKMGVWDTIIGYEVFESVNNPNFTRSYGYTIEPTTHTGLLGSYSFCEFFSANVGVANTFGSAINARANPPQAESYKAYMGSLVLTAPQSWGFLAGSTLTGCIINGFNSASPAVGSAANQTSWYVGAVFNTPVKGLKLGVAYDYAGVSKQDLTLDNSGYANALAGYLSFQATEKLSLHLRGEYATSGSPAAFMAESVVAVTGTVQYDLWKNVVSRLEFRWDHAADGTKPYGGTSSSDPGDNADSYILMANIAYKF
jgi:hypothetical protein